MKGVERVVCKKIAHGVVTRKMLAKTAKKRASFEEKKNTLLLRAHLKVYQLSYCTVLLYCIIATIVISHVPKR